MNDLHATLLASPADRDLAAELAAVVDDCRIVDWQPGGEVGPPPGGIAIFVTRAAGFAGVCDAIALLVAARRDLTCLVAGPDLDARQPLEALAAGAVDFLSLPCRPDELRARLCRARGLVPSRPAPSARDPRLGNLVGDSAAFRAVLDRVPTIADCDASVLLHGESGTGKELFAQAVHYLSRRASRPWVAVNCGAIPRDLLESELFGHVRGAFTTAHAGRTGLVREAEGGTLFLDDIDCLPLDAQAKLLRFLQEREYRQVGSNALQHADVRIIAASNRSLRRLADEGRFRLDLFFRLDILRLTLPPLRARGADVAVLAQHFAREFARKFARAGTALSPAALRKLLAYDWPGNIRELRYVLERSILLSRGANLEPADIELEDEGEALDALSFRAAKTLVVERFERQTIERLLATHAGNVAQAARAAGKNRRAFFELMRKYAIDASQYRPEPGVDSPDESAARGEPAGNVYPLRRPRARGAGDASRAATPAL
jgi:two-component system response regulator GlrR